ncbi:MAG: adenosine deaminase [Synergistaceae bacterium]|nr:adenosine deaminase [Synergistaceae bacterium]MBR0203315.1 adenosine deaminase [Synergistaceae bacterium]
MKKLKFFVSVIALLCVISCTAFAGDKYIDIHLHLDGALTLDIAKKLADLQNIKLPASSDSELEKLLTVPEDCKSLNEFLERFALPLTLMQTPEGLRESVRLVLDNIKSQGVVYAEVRYAPQLHCDKGMTQEDAIKAALEGLKESSLKANLILCLMRGEGNDAANFETVELAKKYLVQDGGVVAIDLAGAEALFPTSDYAKFFELARSYNIPFTIHAGEADGAQSVRDAITFGAVRIGHGVRIYESPDVEALVKSKGICLELCPTSSRLTHAVEDMKNYPFMRYLHDEIRVTLNTDDMGIENITLANEFKYMRENFGLTHEDERIILNNAINAAFTTDEVKESLRKIIFEE